MTLLRMNLFKSVTFLYPVCSLTVEDLEVFNTVCLKEIRIYSSKAGLLSHSGEFSLTKGGVNFGIIIFNKFVEYMTNIQIKWSRVHQKKKKKGKSVNNRIK